MRLNIVTVHSSLQFPGFCALSIYIIIIQLYLHLLYSKNVIKITIPISTDIFNVSNMIFGSSNHIFCFIKLSKSLNLAS